MSHESNLVDTIKELLTKQGLIFSFNEEEQVFQVKYLLSSKSQEVMKVTLKIGVCSDGVLSGAFFPFSAKNVLPEVAELIARINYTLRNGYFSLDYQNGQIMSRAFLPCQFTIPDDCNLWNTITLPLALVKKYGDSIVSVLSGLKSPEEAVNACLSSI